jgi:glycerophosphoryl diester phosphodiesterase
MTPAPRIIAHRGARSLAPENTRAAATAARHLGAHAWETDVQITRDNRGEFMKRAGAPGKKRGD